MFLNVETKQVYVKGGAGNLGDGGNVSKVI